MVTNTISFITVVIGLNEMKSWAICDYNAMTIYCGALTDWVTNDSIINVINIDPKLMACHRGNRITSHWWTSLCNRAGFHENLQKYWFICISSALAMEILQSCTKPSMCNNGKASVFSLDYTYFVIPEGWIEFISYCARNVPGKWDLYYTCWCPGFLLR